MRFGCTSYSYLTFPTCIPVYDPFATHFKNFYSGNMHDGVLQTFVAAVVKATDDLDPCAVGPGTWVRVHVANVGPQQAEGVLQRLQAAQQGQAPPLAVFGIMTHECKMSVVNFAVKKSPQYTGTIMSQLLC